MQLENGTYSAEIPANAFDQQWDILYYFEATDIYGYGVIRPDFRERTPYCVIEMER